MLDEALRMAHAGRAERFGWAKDAASRDAAVRERYLRELAVWEAWWRDVLLYTSAGGHEGATNPDRAGALIEEGKLYRASENRDVPPLPGSDPGVALRKRRSAARAGESHAGPALARKARGGSPLTKEQSFPIEGLTSMARTVGVRFRQAGKLFYYDALDFELEVGNYVVVDSAHGVTAGRVVIAPDQVIANEASTAERHQARPAHRHARRPRAHARDAGTRTRRPYRGKKKGV